MHNSTFSGAYSDLAQRKRTRFDHAKFWILIILGFLIRKPYPEQCGSQRSFAPLPGGNQRVALHRQARALPVGRQPKRKRPVLLRLQSPLHFASDREALQSCERNVFLACAWSPKTRETTDRVLKVSTTTRNWGSREQEAMIVCR